MLRDLEVKYGEAFYLLNLDQFRYNYNSLLEKFQSIYSKTIIGYSYKTNYTLDICTVVNQLGGFAEVVSDFEYEIAKHVGVPDEKIIVNGPYKRYCDLEKYLLGGCIVNLDSKNEVANFEKVAQKNIHVPIKVGLRCNISIPGDTHSRFGLDTSHHEFSDILDRIQRLPNVTLSGIHCHLPNRDIKSFQLRTARMLELADKIFETAPEYIDIGGGFFSDMPIELKQQFTATHATYDEYAEEIANKFNGKYQHLNPEERPTLILEPGSALVGNVMNFVAKVVALKELNQRNISVVAGSKFNLGSFSSSIAMPLHVHNQRENDPSHAETWDIAGYTCIESDYLTRNFNGSIEVGDFVVYDNIGSYSVVFKPPFILPNVPIINISPNEGNKEKLSKRAEHTYDILATYLLDPKV